MTIKTVTISTLIDDYAQDIADEAGLDPADYTRTADGLALLLAHVAEGISPRDHTHDWLTDAVATLHALQRTDATSDQAHMLLTRVDSLLYQAQTDLT